MMNIISSQHVYVQTLFDKNMLKVSHTTNLIFNPTEPTPNKTESKTAGIIAYSNVKTTKRADGSLVIMNKIGEIIIKSEEGDEKERYPAIYGATIAFKDGDKVNVGDRILEWDPFAMPTLAEVSGKILFEDMVVGSTVKEEMDAVTGLSHKVIIESKSK